MADFTNPTTVSKVSKNYHAGYVESLKSYRYLSISSIKIFRFSVSMTNIDNNLTITTLLLLWQHDNDVMYMHAA